MYCSGIQLGTGTNGVGDFVDSSPGPVVLKYVEIPHFPICTVEGHVGELVCGNFSGVPVYCLKGRKHYYEGTSMGRNTFPILVLAKLGIKILVLTNAGGCLELDWKLGDITLLTDHVNMFASNPCVGPNLDLFPPHSSRFIDLVDCYNAKLRDIVKKIGHEVGIEFREGVYYGFRGPYYETQAEIGLMRLCKAQCLGQSTIGEVILARHCGVRVVALSVMTDICVLNASPKHEEIMEIARGATESIVKVFRAAMPSLAKEAL
jgi:purine-nucleoside phosphorylase